jgi:hypothetical protein
MSQFDFVADRVQALMERISRAAERAGRKASETELLAVTKFQPIQAAAAAWDSGIRAFGESRVQEAEVKYADFLAERPSARLDMIGHLQSNKAKKAVALFARLQSVDSVELLLELDARAAAAALRREVLLELHTGEDSKEGFHDEDELCRALDLLLSRPIRHLEPRGLMTMAPNSDDTALVRGSFRRLRAALERAHVRFGLPDFDQLSMGMSGDFEIAVEEGSTLVRIGTALFGERPT